MRIARQRAAAALRGDGQQAARGQLNDGLIAPLGARLKALRIVLARLHGVELGTAGHGAAPLADEPLHDGIKLHGLALRRGGRHLQKDVGYAEHLEEGIPRVHREVLGTDEEHGGQVNGLRLAYNHGGGVQLLWAGGCACGLRIVIPGATAHRAAQVPRLDDFPAQGRLSIDD